MNTGLKALCDDPLKLKEIIGKRDETIHQQQRRINQLEELVRLQKHRQFGASSEKSSDQGELFDEAEERSLNEWILNWGVIRWRAGWSKAHKGYNHSGTYLKINYYQALIFMEMRPRYRY